MPINRLLLQCSQASGQGTGGTLLRFFNWLIICGVFTGCSPLFSKKSPVVLVLVDALAERDYLCSDKPLFEQLESLQAECESFQRFTHAFSPSPLLQPQLASLMTGLEVSGHGVRTNGAEALSNIEVTLAERALKQRMRTGFFSGGLPLQAKFGLTQGVEIFNDSFDERPSRFFRPLSQSVERAMRWLDQEVKRRSFFMVLYVPDLLLSHDDEIEEPLEDERPKDRSGRLRQIYQSLDFLIKELKVRKRWDNTHFIFLGLGETSRQLHSLNPLSSELLHVPLQVKLAKNLRTSLKDLSGELISFAHLGDWMKALIEQAPGQRRLKFVGSGDKTWIPQQSHLWSWLGVSQWPHLGLRTKPHLVTLFDQWRAYESFTDRREVDPMDIKDTEKLVTELKSRTHIQNEFSKECSRILSAEQRTSMNCAEEPNFNQGLRQDLLKLVSWSERQQEPESERLDIGAWLQQPSSSQSPRLYGWLAVQALRQRDWASLFELGQKAKERSWVLVAQLNFREIISGYQSGCLSYFVNIEKDTSDFYRHCQDSELRQVIDGLTHLRKKQKASENFWRQVSSMNKRRRAKSTNLMMYFKNDIKDPFDFKPSLAELYFFIPEHASFLDLLDLDKT